MNKHYQRNGVTAFLIDLDGSKPINDSNSHNADHAMLCAIAQRLEPLVNKEGMVAR